jgi:hypothetical protein
MAEVAVGGPFGEFDLGDELGGQYPKSEYRVLIRRAGGMLFICAMSLFVK